MDDVGAAGPDAVMADADADDDAGVASVSDGDMGIPAGVKRKHPGCLPNVDAAGPGAVEGKNRRGRPRKSVKGSRKDRRQNEWSTEFNSKVSVASGVTTQGVQVVFDVRGLSIKKISRIKNCGSFFKSHK